jgi:hypothetical protein
MDPEQGVGNIAAGLLWDNEYSRRRERAIYPAEDQLLPWSSNSKQDLITEFLYNPSSYLDPPDQFQYLILRRFLENGEVAGLDQGQTSASRNSVLHDDRPQ